MTYIEQLLTQPSSVTTLLRPTFSHLHPVCLTPQVGYEEERCPPSHEWEGSAARERSRSGMSHCRLILSSKHRRHRNVAG